VGRANPGARGRWTGNAGRGRRSPRAFTRGFSSISLVKGNGLPDQIDNGELLMIVPRFHHDVLPVRMFIRPALGGTFAKRFAFWAWGHDDDSGLG
jgi:hypothetical protein